MTKIKTEIQRDYQRDYYQANREALLAKRRERYNNDPEYRAKILATTRKHGNGDEVVATRGRPLRQRLPKRMTIGGKPVWMYGIYFLAQKTGRSLPTINSWEHKGILPRTPYVSDGGHRMYTAEQIEAVAKVVGTRRMARLPNRDNDLYDEVAVMWRKLGIKIPERGGRKNGNGKKGTGRK